MAKTVKPEDQPVILTQRRAAEEDNDTQALQNIEVFYEKNKKQITTAVVAVVAIVAGIIGYKYYTNSQNEKAAGKAFYAEQYFMQDSVSKALNGDDQKHYGFLKVAREFGGTKVGNLAHYYAGVCYLKQSDPKNAIKQLEDFDGKGTMVGTAAYGLLGDAYMETNNTSKAIDNYKKATENEKDVVQTPKYLFSLGVAYEQTKKPDEAKKAYERIRDEYPTSMQAREIDRYLARLGVIE